MMKLPFPILCLIQLTLVLSVPRAGAAEQTGLTKTAAEDASGSRRELVGIGAALVLDPPSRALQISRVVPGSPAEQAGLSSGWSIQKIDGRRVEGQTLAECIELIRGEAGTRVRLELVDARRGATNTVVLTRQTIVLSDVPQVSATSLLSPEQMREDLDYTVGILRDVHPVTVHGFSEQQQAAIDAAYRRIQEPATVSRFYFIVNSVIASLQDGHTRLRLLPDGQRRRIPGPILWLQDGFFVPQDCEPFQRGDRIVDIGGQDIDAVYQRMRALIPAENEPYRKSSMAGLIQREEFLDYLGCVNEDTVEIGVERSGDRTALIAPLACTAPCPTWPPSRPWVGYCIDTDLSLGVFRLDACKPNQQFSDVVRAFFAEVGEKGVQNIVIDVRRNGGGSSKVITEFFTYLDVDRYTSYHADIRYSEEAAQRRGLNRNSGYVRGEPSRVQNDKVRDVTLRFRGRLYVLTSTRTYSGGNWFAVIIKDNGLGTVIGEPTGNAPTSYGDVLDFQMPRSKLGFVVSYKTWHRPDPARDPEEALHPDIPVYTTIVDPHDPVTLVISAWVVLAAAALAAWIPARRATKVNPIEALRAE